MQDILKTCPRLYKVGGIGQVLQWDIDVIIAAGSPEASTVDAGLIVIKHGQVDGKIQRDAELVEFGKNIGKANETTPVQQALNQAESRWLKQHDSGYRESIEEAQKAAKASTKPMLAHKLSDKGHKLVKGRTYGSQAKLDGMRCIAHWVSAWPGTGPDLDIELLSRKGKVIESVPHINAELRAFLPKDAVWDGELYVHDMEFEKNQSICKRKAKNLHPEYASMQYHIFDRATPDIYADRITGVACALGEHPNCILHVVAWHTIIYKNEDQLVLLAEEYEGLGYEGLILRDLEDGYEHKRSIQLIKVKRFQDAEYLIKGTQEGKAGTDQEGLLIKFLIEYIKKDGTGVDTCEATLMGTESIRREMLTRREEYIGKWATVKYQELSKYGAPRFSKVKAIREMENLQPLY